MLCWQSIQLEEDLEAIERIVKRVEIANEHGALYANSSSGITLTSALPGSVALDTVRVPRAAQMIEVIQQYSDLCAEIERLVAKPIEVQVDFPTEDFPTETADRLEVIARCDKYTHAIAVKDHMLWLAMQEKAKAEDELEQERQLTQEYAEEVARWAQMSRDYAMQVHGLKKDLEASDKRVEELTALLRKHNIHYHAL